MSIGGFVLELESGASDIIISGLSFAHGQYNLISGSGVSNVTIVDSKFFNGGQAGVSISDSYDVLVKSSIVKNVGCKGINLIGGDRVTLEHGKLRAIGNSVSK